MGLFDNLAKKSPSAGGAQNADRDVVFPDLPETFEEFVALPQASLSNPSDTAALTILALCFYPQDKDTSLKILDYLRGPRPLSVMDKQFIADRFRDQDYIPRSYFVGSTPANDYVPSKPYTVKVTEGKYARTNEGYVTLDIRSGGADSPRQITVRQAKDGKWYLWEQQVLVGIRVPDSADPWA
jgi:hypothetical protein